MPFNVNIINKQIFEFECEQSEHAFQIQKKVDYEVQEKITKAIDQVCTELAVENLNLHIPLLEINLGKIPFDQLDKEFVSGFEKEFYKKLAEWKDKHIAINSAMSSEHESTFEIVKTFLLTGRLPWFAGKPEIDYFERLFVEIFSTKTEELKDFILLNLSNDKFIERLTSQLDTAILNTTIKLLDINTDLIIEIENEIRNSIKEIIFRINKIISNAQPVHGDLSLLKKVFDEFRIEEERLNELSNTGIKESDIQIDEITITKPDKRDLSIFNRITEAFKGEEKRLFELLSTIFNEDGIQLHRIANVEIADGDLALQEKEIEEFKIEEKRLLELLNKYLQESNIQLNIIKDKSQDNKDSSYREKVTEIFKGEEKRLKELLSTVLEEGGIQIHKIVFELVAKLISEKNMSLNEGELDTRFKIMIAEKFELSHEILEQLSPKEIDHYKQLLELILQEREKLKISKKQTQEMVEKNAEVRFYISNAGLVIIANYLPLFFNELQLLKDGNFLGKLSQIKAVFLLHYLCTSEEMAPEYILPLNKILCGLNLDEPLPSFISLSDRDKNECNELLSEIIKNWQKLGNTSVDAFREAFLNRAGIISFENNGWKLQVERKGFDVLLDALPWSFSHIKLNWMGNIIATEW